MAIASFAAIVGCSSGRQPVAAVNGVVRLDGKPLTSGRVTFWPRGGRSASGDIRGDGTYTLTTYREGDGAIVGPARVTVIDAAPTPSGPPDVDHDQPNRVAARSLIPANYANPDSSGLAFEVRRGTNVAEFDLRSTR